jgi:uncharacterized protein (DUF927 family)
MLILSRGGDMTNKDIALKNKALNEALAAIPYITLNNTGTHIVLSREDFSICVNTYSKALVKNARALWEENRCSVPTKPWHFCFRKEISDALFEVAVALGEVAIKVKK